MKKRILLTMLAAVLLLMLSGCACEHQWVDADCLTPQTCSLCEKTEGEPLGHDWLAADCVQPEHCSRCEATQGDPLGHTFADADCVTPMTCTVCAATEGDPLGHTFADADCVTPKTCTVCAATEGEPLGHTFADATCTAPMTCTLCGLTEGEAAAHSYGAWVVEDKQPSRKCLDCEAVEQADVEARLPGEWHIIGGYRDGTAVTTAELGIDGIDLLWFVFAADGTGILGSEVMDPQETPCIWQTADVLTTEDGNALLLAVDMLIGEEPQMRVVLCTDYAEFHYITAPGLGLCDGLIMEQLDME